MEPSVFISYSRQEEKEKDLLLTHLGVLQRAGLIEVWSDDRLSPGSDWEREIKQAVAQARVAILLISANFLNSSFILQQEVPALLKRRQEEGLVIFPVIAKACAWKKIDWLAQMEVRPKSSRPVWSEGGRHVDEDLAAIAEEVADIFGQPDKALEPQPAPTIEPPASRPNDLEIELPYGTMRPDSKFYIERSADEQCWEHIGQQEAVTLFIQAPRQMGKSSLMNRMLDRTGKKLNKKSAFIDFQKFPENHFENKEKFFIEFCYTLSDALGIPEAIDQYWQGPRANIIKCSLYLSEYIIPKINEPFILAMDEVERMLTSPFRADFFGMLRTWHNHRVFDENLAKLTLFLSSSTEPYLFIDNPNQSPFNVAELIRLQDFTRAEVEELNKRHHYPLSQSQLDDLMDLIAGHPYLTRRALYLLATGKIDMETLLGQATAEMGPFGVHLDHYLRLVLEKPELKQALTHICRHHTYEENKIFHRLKGAGLIKQVDQQVIFRNNLYDRYFREHLDCPAT